MKAEELRLDELVHFGEGLVDLHGRRLILQDTVSFGQFRRDLIEMVGQEDARRIMTRWGYFWGQVDAATMQRLFQWDSLAEWLKAALRLHRIMGAWHDHGPILRVGSGNGPPSRRNSPATTPSRRTTTRRNSGLRTNPAAGLSWDISAGTLPTAWGRACTSWNESAAPRAMNDVWRWAWTSTPGDREIAEDLSYFHATDIQGKIQALSDQLHEKELELQRQQSQVEPSGRARIASVEVRSREFQRVVELADSRGQVRFVGADHRRDRRGQGGGGALHPQPVASLQGPVRRDQLRRTAGNAVGEHTFRPQGRRVYRGNERPAGAL